MRKIIFIAIMLTGLLAQAQKPFFLIKAPDMPLAGVQRVAVLDFTETNHTYYNQYDGRGKKMTNQLIQLWMQDQRGIGKVSIGVFKQADGETKQKGVKTNIFSFVERTEMERILKEQRLSMSGVIDDSQAAQVGKILGIDAIISGTVGWTENMESGTNKRIRKVRATLTMKIISVNTGEVLAMFNKDVTREASQTMDAKTGTWSTLTAGSALADQAFDALAILAANYIAPIFESKEFDFRKVKVKEHSAQGKKAADLMDSGDYEGAFTIYSSIVAADPYCAEALSNAGAIYCIYGNFEKALEFYKQAAEIDRSEYGKDLDFAQKKHEELAVLSSIGIVPPVNELAADSHSATANSVKTRGGKSDRYEVYTFPDPKFSVVTKVPGDTEFENLGINGEFILIKLLGGKEGYIKKDMVKM